MDNHDMAIKLHLMYCRIALLKIIVSRFWYGLGPILILIWSDAGISFWKESEISSSLCLLISCSLIYLNTSYTNRVCFPVHANVGILDMHEHNMTWSWGKMSETSGCTWMMLRIEMYLLLSQSRLLVPVETMMFLGWSRRLITSRTVVFLTCVRLDWSSSTVRGV